MVRALPRLVDGTLTCTGTNNNMQYTPKNIPTTTLRVKILAFNKAGRSLSVQLPDGSTISMTNIKLSTYHDNIQDAFERVNLVVGKSYNVPYPINAFFDDPTGVHTLI